MKIWKIGLIVAGVISVSMMSFVVGTWFEYFRMTKDPPTTCTSDQQCYSNIQKYCTAVPIDLIPSQYLQWLPPEYRNGSYVIYSCKVK
jgi:hypothetical protein